MDVNNQVLRFLCGGTAEVGEVGAAEYCFSGPMMARPAKAIA
jgi:hypothetical protein